MPARSAISILAAATPIARTRPCLLSYKPVIFPIPKTVRPQRNVRRAFHASPVRRDDAIDNARNHYETLKVPPTASPAEIKKSFYTLSKTHHPDVHTTPNRRLAARRFMRISEAYSILSSPSKRAKYDRDHMNLSPPPTTTPKGSYASTGPAGGRPASGLSRRRSTFQGPPPSFFRSGGWGAQGDKRRAAHESSTGGMGGMGPGQDPYGHRNDVPHFDRESHETTWRNTDRRREARRVRTEPTIGPEKGVAGMFFFVSGVLMLGFVVPFFVSRLWMGAAKPLPPVREEKEKGRKSGSS